METNNVSRFPLKSSIRIALVTLFILSIPLVAMQFTREVKWDLADFIIVGILLFGAGMLYEFLAVKMPRHRLVIGIAVVVTVLLVWAELAVGIFD